MAGLRDRIVSEYPQKEFYRLNEVCRYTDTQPYVLRFWESEFPQLNPKRSGNGQPVYRKEDIDLVRRIKQLLYEEECSLEGARQALDSGKSPSPRKKTKAGPSETPAVPATSSSAAGKLRGEAVKQARIILEVPDEDPPQRGSNGDLVPRQRYEDAVEEVHHLRLRVKEAETARRKAEVSLEEAADEGERYRRKAATAGERIEELLESLS